MPLRHPAWNALVSVVGGDSAALEHKLAEICSGISNPRNLDKIEILALWVYSHSIASWYSKINEELWNRPSHETLEISRIICAALKKLVCQESFVYRGYFAQNLDLFMMNYYAGQRITFPGFTSASINQYQMHFGNVTYIIYSRTGRLLGSYADDPREEEVLFANDSWFNISKLERYPNSAVIWLDDVT